MRKGTKMSAAGRLNLSKSCKGRTPWNKGLTKEDPRVLKNVCGNSAKTQFKAGPRPETKGKGNSHWKGGKIIHQGYVYIRAQDHPYAKNGYMQEHRLVMEKKLGRFLKPQEIVHHMTHDTMDNRIENLMLLNQSKHATGHNLERWREYRMKQQKKSIDGD